MDGLGERLRSARQRQGISLRELARRLEVSPSLISQIETGKAQPSVNTLYGMVNVLAISLDQLFTADPSGARQTTGEEPAPAAGGPRAAGRTADGAPPAIVRRAGEHRALRLTSGVRWEELATDPEADIEFLHIVYGPGSSSSDDGSLLRHAGREAGMIISGRLHVSLGFEEHVLGPGDSITFASSIPHRFSNARSDDVHAVWLVMGRQAAPRGVGGPCTAPR